MSPILKFLASARSLASQGFKKEQIYEFAQREFGEINELMQKQIENIFKPKKPIVSRNKPLDPDDVLPNYNETPGEFARRETPGSKENLLQELKIAYEKEFNRLRGDETAEELKEMLKNLDTDGVPFASGGRAGYAVGNQVMPAVDARMQNTYDENTRINDATRIVNQMARNYDFSGLSQYGLNQKTYDSTPGPMKGIPAVGGVREKLIQDLANRTQSNYTPAPKPRPKTYRAYSPEAQALNMDQSTYENIISMGADPRQYYMDFNNRTMTEGQNYGTPGTSNYTGPALLKYGQVIGGPGGMMGLGRSTQNTSPPTQAQINAQMQQMQNNPQGFQDFDEVVKYYGSNDPYMSQQQEILDMVNGVDTGYMSGQDYYDINVLGLDGQGIAEKYGIAYSRGGRAGYYGGGQAVVGEDLSEIGHGSDSLMARNMQIAPGGQATTSTGLNYLLGQDNDTVRVPYSKGKIAKKAVDEGRRGFMKAAGAGAAGLAALKTGLLGFGEKVAPVAKEAVEAAKVLHKVCPLIFGS